MAKLKPGVIAFFLFIVFDFLWLGFVMKDFNLRQLAEIGRIENGDFNIQYAAAVGAYFFMALAVAFFVLPQLSVRSGFLSIFMRGALMGLVLYGVYDMTNLAILKSYPLAFVAADMAWGTFLYGLVTYISSRFVSS